MAGEPKELRFWPVFSVLLVMLVILSLAVFVPWSVCPTCRDPGNRKGTAASCDSCEERGRVSLMWKWNAWRAGYLR